MSVHDPHAQPAWPVLRLLRAGISFWTLLLAFAAVLSIYATGRILDAAWVQSGNGLVLRQKQTEVTAFAGGSGALAVWRQMTENAPEDAERVGPFSALARHEADCFAQTVNGVATGRLLFAPGGTLPAGLAGELGDASIERELLARMGREMSRVMTAGQPSLLSGVTRGLAGFGWLVTQRPLFAILFGGISLAILSFFGMAICRFHAIRTTRNETAPIGAVMNFTREKWRAAFVAPLLPLFLLTGIAVALMVVGLIGAIPVLGEWFAALTYGLALLLGVGLAFCALASVFGFPLMWPTVALEGSDSFDGVQHAAGYLFQRPGLVSLYGLIHVAFVSVAFLFARFVFMLVLKLTHVFTGVGIGAFGAVHSSAGEELGKLEGMWQMPAWADLSVLPAAVPFWGVFDPTESLGGSQGAAGFVLAVWVFCLVGLLAAFVLNAVLVGWTELYILLRNQIDGIEYDFIFCEELDDELESDLNPEPDDQAPADEPAAG